MICIALDVGRKRIGVAKTDELGLLAHPAGCVRRTSDEAARAEIRRLVLQWGAEKLVVGLPKEMSGEIGPAAREVLDFAEPLRADLPGVELLFWDERLTTKGTERILIELDVSRRKRRSLVDALSAQWLLAGFLEAERVKGEQGG